MTEAGLVAEPALVTELLAALDVYRPARQQLLATLGLGPSNRDPLAEFSEHFVMALMGGTLASSRVQAHYDLITPAGQKVQVRYLANPSEVWVNEHLVYRIAGVEWYALVLFETFAVTAVLAFPQELMAIGAELGKRHPRQDETLQLTRRNYWAMRGSPHRFRSLGMQIWLPPFR